MRLNVFIAKSGHSSRRKADLLVKKGKVSVNGKLVVEPFFDVAKDDRVKVEGRSIGLKEFSYLLFNKPKGVTTTRSDRFASSKVVDFLPSNLKDLYPVGRLDKNSTGLLILTNDGKFCYELTHPKFQIEKEYLALVKGKVTLRHCGFAKKGVTSEGDLLKVKEITILRGDRDETFCKVIVCEGKKRNLRRLFIGLGFKVKALKRVRVGGLVLGGLKEGKSRILDREKIFSLVFKR